MFAPKGIDTPPSWLSLLCLENCDADWPFKMIYGPLDGGHLCLIVVAPLANKSFSWGSTGMK